LNYFLRNERKKKGRLARRPPPVRKNGGGGGGGGWGGGGGGGGVGGGGGGSFPLRGNTKYTNGCPLKNRERVLIRRFTNKFRKNREFQLFSGKRSAKCSGHDNL